MICSPVGQSIKHFRSIGLGCPFQDNRLQRAFDGVTAYVLGFKGEQQNIHDLLGGGETLKGHLQEVPRSGRLIIRLPLVPAVRSRALIVGARGVASQSQPVIWPSGGPTSGLIFLPGEDLLRTPTDKGGPTADRISRIASWR